MKDPNLANKSRVTSNSVLIPINDDAYFVCKYAKAEEIEDIDMNLSCIFDDVKWFNQILPIIGRVTLLESFFKKKNSSECDSFVCARLLAFIQTTRLIQQIEDILYNAFHLLRSAFPSSLKKSVNDGTTNWQLQSQIIRKDPILWTCSIDNAGIIRYSQRGQTMLIPFLDNLESTILHGIKQECLRLVYREASFLYHKNCVANLENLAVQILVSNQT
jgi:hypothetical protein